MCGSQYRSRISGNATTAEAVRIGERIKREAATK
jgi:hypothetical protein